MLPRVLSQGCSWCACSTSLFSIYLLCNLSAMNRKSVEMHCKWERLLPNTQSQAAVAWKDTVYLWLHRKDSFSVALKSLSLHEQTDTQACCNFWDATIAMSTTLIAQQDHVVTLFVWHAIVCQKKFCIVQNNDKVSSAEIHSFAFVVSF